LENIPHEFKELNIYEEPGASELKKLNPINQIPVLVDGKNTIWDSRQIFNYLNALHRFQNMDWEDENRLTAIDGAMNAGISLFLMKKSGINIDEPLMYVQRQKERMELILNYLKPLMTGEGLTTWDFHSISIYSFLDWALFREVIKIDHRPECQAFLNQHRNRSSVISTERPKA